MEELKNMFCPDCGKQTVQVLEETYFLAVHDKKKELDYCADLSRIECKTCAFHFYVGE